MAGRIGANARAKFAVALGLLAVAGLALLLPAGTSSAATSPNPFYGVVLADTPSRSDWQLMSNSGVGSVRLAVAWNAMQPKGHGPIDFSSTDAVIGSAAAQGIQVLPFVGGTPAGLANDSTIMPIRNARQRSAWSSFLYALVKRYGPDGDFWQNPYQPYLPIRTWQIWNEQNTLFFARPASPAAYDTLLALSAGVIRSADPGAKILIGGMLGRPAAKPPVAWRADDFVDRMYDARPSIRRSFTGVGLHPYSEQIGQVGIQAKDMRNVFAQHGDRRKTLAITEITWGAGPRGSGWLEEGPQGQAQKLRQMYGLFYRHRFGWRVSGVYWFSWRSHKSVPECVFCRTSGLLDLGGDPTPALRAFQSLAG